MLRAHTRPWLLALTLAGTLSIAGAAQAPEVGQPAPEFKLTGTDGATYKLGQFKGNSAVILAWYPKALTPGCTAECNSLSDELAGLRKYQVEVFGASVDAPEANQEFAQKHHYRFVLLSDPDKSYARALGVLNEKAGVANRWTYILDDQGVIRYIDRAIVPGSHGKDLQDRLAALGIPKRK